MERLFVNGFLMLFRFEGQEYLKCILAEKYISIMLISFGGFVAKRFKMFCKMFR